MQSTPARIFFMVIVLALLGVMSDIVFRTFSFFLSLSPEAQGYILIPLIGFPVAILITMIFSNFSYHRWFAILYTVSIFWAPVLMYLFIAAVFMSIAGLLIPNMTFHHTLGIVILIFIVVLMIQGVYEALHPKVKTYTLKAPLLMEKWSTKKIVLFSDSHLGLVRNRAFMQKIVQMINKLSPDVVLIAGDLIDGPIFPYEEGLSPLADIKSTYGTYYTAGNHDEYNREQKKYYDSLNKYVHVLNDAKAIVNDTQIVGVMYANESLDATKERLVKTGYEKSMPSIVLLHDPKNVHALADSGVTLALSGHTHAGQFFPFSLIVRSVYGPLTRGINYIKEMAQFTSVGIGTAGPIFRIGAEPELVVIEIQ